jgi:lysine 2,3-aminomutase
MTIAIPAAALVRQQAPAHALLPAVDPASITWRRFRRDEFWREVGPWRAVDAPTFLDYLWQEKNAVTNVKGVLRLVGERLDRTFVEDLEEGIRRSPMAVRISPYIISLIDWDHPVSDPLRRQFLPLVSQLEPDHPLVTLDSLAEQADSPVPGLTHRYFDRALFLTTDQCPVYCRYCTRSYAVGNDTDDVTKVAYPVDVTRWDRVLQYLSERIEIEDVVISGGDTFRLKPAHILLIGHRLLDIPHVRRIRFATKGLAVQPMKILTDQAWTDALTEVAVRGRRIHKEVSVHTHFNHPHEFTGITEDALNVLFERGIPVRNLTVLLRGVNDNASAQLELTRRLIRINVRPYYTYVGDMVKGTDDLRTSVSDGMALEKIVRGAATGHQTPIFVLDAPGGGGKRNVFSYEHYDRETGISVYSAPSVKPGRMFVYGDPLHALSDTIRQRWQDPRDSREMIEDALASARSNAARSTPLR